MSRKEYLFYIEADRIISGRPRRSFRRKIILFFIPDYIGRFMALLRKTEYLTGKSGPINKIDLIITRIRFKKISLKLGFSIPPHVFGPGLYIPHYGTIVVNSNARVGANCVLHTSTCIGGSEPKLLGNNIYISTGVIIVGEVTLADNISISANSLVNRSFSDKNVLIGGSPAGFIKESKAWFDREQAFEERIRQIDKLYNSMFGHEYNPINK